MIENDGIEEGKKSSPLFWRVVFYLASAAVCICLVAIVVMFVGEPGRPTANIDATKTTTMPARSVRIGNSITPYIIDTHSAEVPETGAVLWHGNDSTTDDALGYFAGHTPGDFENVIDLEIGDIVTVCDSLALTRDYEVVDVFSVKEGTTLSEIKGRISGYGESIGLQTCEWVGDSYRVVVCQAC